MEQSNTVQALLDQLPQPAFQAVENVITAVNPAAKAMLLSPGDPVLPLMEGGSEDYQHFSSGALFLKLNIGSILHSATVTCAEGKQLFLLEEVQPEEAFRIMALTSMELRKPISSLISSLSMLLEKTELSSAPHTPEVTRSLMRLTRLVNNLSDAGRFQTDCRKETREVTAFLREILEKAQTLTQDFGPKLHWELPDQSVLCLMDPEQMERAVWNLLSNALKFTPAGGDVHVRLVRKGNRLSLSVTDSGSGMADSILSTLFSRYQRSPGLEDFRFGLGLGMAILKAAAANHGGTVLVDQPEGRTRITLSFPIRQSGQEQLQSPFLRPDYSNGWDHGLVELSDSLPASAYKDIL